MAAWGAQTRSGRTEDQAIAYLTALFRNVPVQDSSARAALQTFVGGTGDVMLAYENEAIQAQHDGQEIDYVIPDRTILIENPVALTKVGDVPETARAFVDFLTTPNAQMAYAITGYRPVVPEELARYTNFPRPSGLFTIDDLGGWDAVTARFFDPDHRDRRRDRAGDRHHALSVGIPNAAPTAKYVPNVTCLLFPLCLSYRPTKWPLSTRLRPEGAPTHGRRRRGAQHNSHDHAPCKEDPCSTDW